MNDLFRRRIAEHGGKAGAQFGHRFHPPIGFEIVFEKAVARAWNMPTNGVHGFVFAPEAVGASRVKHQKLGMIEIRQHFGHIDAQAWPRPRFEPNRRPRPDLLTERMPCRPPGGKTAVQQRNAVVTQPAQEPPKPSGHHAASVVINYNLRRRNNTKTAKAFGQLRGVRQGMTAIAAIHRPRKIAVKVEKSGSREVAFTIGTFAGRRVGKLVANIDHQPVWVVTFAQQRRDIDQRTKHRRAHSGRRRLIQPRQRFVALRENLHFGIDKYLRQPSTPGDPLAFRHDGNMLEIVGVRARKQ